MHQKQGDKGTYVLHYATLCPMPRKTRQTKTSFYIDADRLVKLREISRRTMIPMSALLRKAVDQVIREYSR
jgi:hypothetical protein